MTENNSDSSLPKNADSRGPNWERSLLERLAFAALTEQRKARRWGIFFKLFIFGYLAIILIMSQSDNWGGKGLHARHTALVEMDGSIFQQRDH